MKIFFYNHGVQNSLVLLTILEDWLLKQRIGILLKILKLFITNKIFHLFKF